MSKFSVRGKDAGSSLNRLCTADVNGAGDTITYTQMLDEDGKVEADVTVMKQSNTHFVVIATDTMHRHVETWLQRHLDPSGEKAVVVSDVTGAFAQLNLQGPLSRDILRSLVKEDTQFGGDGEHNNKDTDPFSEENFPFRAAKEIYVGCTIVRCARITYVGELGFELHIPTEHARHVYDRLTQHCEELSSRGEVFGQGQTLVHGGLKALASLRLEKGYRDYGHDVDNTDTLQESGLGFTADFQKEGGFVGKSSLYCWHLV